MSVPLRHGLADPLIALARRVERLTIDRRDPERFFADRSDIAGELRRLAGTASPRPQPSPRSAAP